MALSSSFVHFIRDWTTKAESIQLRDHDLASYFDKFFTLFVIYNRLSGADAELQEIFNRFEDYRDGFGVEFLTVVDAYLARLP
jgi:hypothetical protein